MTVTKSVNKMNLFNFFNLYLLQNKKLIYYLLQSIKDCIPEEHKDKYALQLDCINKIQWVLDVEVDLYFDDSSECQANLIPEWEREEIIATMIVVDYNNKKYRLSFFVLNGRIFSIESNFPFRYLEKDQIKDIQIECREKELLQ